MIETKSRDWFKILLSLSLGIITFRLISALSSIVSFFLSIIPIDINFLIFPENIIPLCASIIVAIVIPEKVSFKSQKFKAFALVVLFIVALFPFRLNYSQQLVYTDQSEFVPISINLSMIQANPTNSYQLYLQGTDELLNISNTSSMDISHLREASAVYDYIDEEKLLIELRFTKEGQQKLEKVTSENIDKRIGIIIDGVLVYAPFMRERISSDYISVKYEVSNEEIIDIVKRINSTIRFKS